MAIETREQLLETAKAFVSDEGPVIAFDRALRNLSEIFKDNAKGASEDLYTRLIGGAGLHGEWMNGLAVLFMYSLEPHFSDRYAEMKADEVEKGLKNILEQQSKRSQLSLGTTEDGDEKDYKETTRVSYERCGRELRDWFNQRQDMPVEVRQNAQAALDNYDAQWNRVKGFLDDVGAYFERQPA